MGRKKRVGEREKKKMRTLMMICDPGQDPVPLIVFVPIRCWSVV